VPERFQHSYLSPEGVGFLKPAKAFALRCGLFQFGDLAGDDAIDVGQ
jgi:hypothetical protein